MLLARIAAAENLGMPPIRKLDDPELRFRMHHHTTHRAPSSPDVSADAQVPAVLRGGGRAELGQGRPPDLVDLAWPRFLAARQALGRSVTRTCRCWQWCRR